LVNFQKAIAEVNYSEVSLLEVEMYKTIEAIYERGKLISTKLPRKGKYKVMVTILQKLDSKKGEDERFSVYTSLRNRISKEVPELLKMSQEERIEEFKELSQKIRERLPYKSMEEFEQAMRGDNFDLARY